MTFDEAVSKWVNEFNSIPQGMIEMLMRTDPDAWREITLPSRGYRVYVYELPERVYVPGLLGETPDGRPYEGTAHRGEITDCYDNETYRIRMDDGEYIFVKSDDFDVEYDDTLPMWGVMWQFGDSCDEYWLECLDGIRLMSECGFRIYEHDEWGYFFGIDGAGYSFKEAHWMPLYRARGLQWHDKEAKTA